MEKLNIHVASGNIMGGSWQLRHVPARHIAPEHVAQAALEALKSVDEEMSHYKDYSDLMRVNRAAVGEWVAIPESLLLVLDAAQNIGKYTHGALDITLGDAINAWGFGPNPAPKKHPETNVRQRDPSWPSHQSYSLRASPPSICKHHPVNLNLSALAKGFAVDKAAQAVQALGIDSFLIEAAGEIYAQGGRSKQKPWQIGLELPIQNKTLVYGSISLDGKAVATSGGYRKYRRIEGQLAYHTFNPETALPMSGDLLSVSVIDESCMRADALATALFVMGLAKGSAFAEQHAVAALFLSRTDDGICELRSQAWMDALALT